MSNPVKLTSEEVEEVKVIQEGYQKVIFSFGKLYLHRLEMEKVLRQISTDEETLQKTLEDLQKKEATWTENIAKKYGDGNLDMAKGEFIPLEDSEKPVK